MYHYGYRPLLVNHDLAMFCVHRSSAIDDISYSTCHAISQIHVIERSYGVILTCNFTRRSEENITSLYGKEALKLSHHPTKFGDHRKCGSEDIRYLVRHLILQDNVIQNYCISIGGMLSY